MHTNLNPLSVPISTDIGFELYYARRYEEAITQLRSVLQRSPKFPLAHFPVPVVVELGVSQRGTRLGETGINLNGLRNGPKNWWAVQDSNLRPPACKAGALTS